jgi:hypothetical protein
MRIVFKGLLAIGLALAGLTGCGKKEAAADPAAATPEAAPADAAATAAPAPAQPASAGAETLPGANSVRDALAKKDYETAVGGLLALQGIATGDRRQEYINLYAEVVDTLRLESSTDRKAAQAYASLMAARGGR